MRFTPSAFFLHEKNQKFLEHCIFFAFAGVSLAVKIFEAAESEMGKPRILEAIEEVQQEKKGHERKLRYPTPTLAGGLCAAHKP